MNIKILIAIETFLVSLFAYTLGQIIFSKTGNKFFKILNYLVWGTFILVSLLINLDKFLYSISVLLLSLLVIIGFIIKFIKIEKSFLIVFWLLFLVSTISMVCVILTKKFAYNNLNNEAPEGSRGEIGSIGDTGESYFIETLPHKCYVDIVTYIETYFREIKDVNKLDYDKKLYQFKNFYLKYIIKKICY